MSHWKNLNLFWKLFFGAFLIFGAFLAPEVMLVIDFSGLEFAFACLVVYFKPLTDWLKIKYESLPNSMLKLHYSIQTAAFFKPRIFTLQSSFCLIGFVVTGSFLFSTLFLLPAIIGNAVIV
ncbi:hypothetical protein D5R81_17075 [Parashewanella spongiae]|uniref:Uncharacterized protein n=1 Tax=Parashewanella spongiae TaxID=342950 RepID=A0A3A6T6N5_9GAMM|nr:hypothetical protein [Parashewanella spongiae]MCL1079841.1 hypothetical protein [Parashewanella spongiae]RJY06838.1 hypothetical protein D5R81_17075 [Parashewanella spongiae]